MSLIEFESAREKEKKRQWERECREAILEKAKDKYEADKLKEEARQKRGEHVWMLPSVESKLDSYSKKKKKKEKKKKKKKKAKKKDTTSSSSSESDEKDMWIEKPAASLPKRSAEHSTQEQPEVSQESSKRDQWMEMTSLFKTYSRDEIKEMDGTSRKKEKEEERRRKQEADKPGSHARELNPFYKDGGSGLPEEDQGATKLTSPTIGLDATWLKKALQRAKEQAQAENKTLEEIAAQRWGSLEKFNQLLAEAEGRDGKRSQNAWSRKNEDWKRRGPFSGGSSTSKEEKKYRDERNRSQERHRSRDRRSRSKDKKRDRKRSRSREKAESKASNRRKDEKNCRRRHNSSSSDSDSSSSDSSRSRSSSSSSSSMEYSSRREAYKKQSKESHVRSVSGLVKPVDTNFASQNSSVLTGKFHKPGEDFDVGSRLNSSSRVTSSSRGWQKRDYMQEQQKNQEKLKAEESSSESEESDEESLPTKPLQKESVEPAVKPSTAMVVLTDKEMNEVAAKIMKAELVGNDALANKLKKKLEAARCTKANAPSNNENLKRESSGKQEEVIVLTRTNASGFSRPVEEKERESGRKRGGKMKTHGEDGKRNKYFPDDDKYQLKQMFEAEKGTTAEDQNAMFNRAAMRNTERLNDDYDIDDMFMTKAVMKEDAARQAERDKKKAIQEHHRSQRSLESCQWCFENKEMTKHLIVALGTKVYVCLPPHESLTSGHCLIVPIHHITCSVQADEDLWSEIQNFRKSLVRMFNSRDEDCIFFETAKRFRSYPHMVIHCVPLPKSVGDLAPCYFKKAIMECEGTWTQNKKLVDLKNRDVRKAVPKGLPYFFIDFAMDPGYAHVIEDEQDFPHNFAQEIVGGMLDLEPSAWRKPRKESFEVQRRKVMEFSRSYKNFDITQDD